MSLFNVLWFVFFGWFNAFLVLILSGFMAITIIGLPIAKSLLQFAKFSMFPFGKEVVRDKKLKNKPNAFLVSIIANIIWLPAGLFLTLVYFLLGVIMISTIVGIRIGIVYWVVLYNPLKVVVELNIRLVMVYSWDTPIHF